MNCKPAQLPRGSVCSTARAETHPRRRNQIYFEKIHPSVPMIHKFRYLAAMNL